jgi:hypothetical protein
MNAQGEDIPDFIPEDSERLTKREMGIYDKYFVMRGDLQDMRGGRHFGCKHFVIDISHDPFAKETLLRYAELCEKEYPNLARDLRAMFPDAPPIANPEQSKPKRKRKNPDANNND